MSTVDTKLASFAIQVSKDWKDNQVTDRRQDEAIGNLQTLKTEAKTSVVEAINEVASKQKAEESAPDYAALFLLKVS